MRLGAQNFKRNRERMLTEQIMARGIDNERVLAGMAAVPRHLFVDEAMAAEAYED